MADDDVRALFHRIDDGPPLGIDVHEVMSRGRRVRTRRVAWAAAGSTVAVAVAAVIGLSSGAEVPPPELTRPAGPPATSTDTSPAANQPPPPPSNTSVPGPNGGPSPNSNPPAPGNVTPPGGGPGGSAPTGAG